MVKRIIDAILCSMEALEDKDIITLEIEWMGVLIDAGNHVSGSK